MRSRTPILSSLPIFRSGKGSASSAALIVEALACRHEMTISELHRELFILFKYKISYQGVRKIVLNLQEEDVLEENLGRYRINRDWLLKARASLDRLLTATFLTGSKHVASVDNLELYRADSLFSADTLWGDLLKELCEKSNVAEKSIVSINHQAFWIPLNIGRETELFSTLLNDGWKVLFVFSNKSKLNAWATKLYREIGVRAVTRRLDTIPDTTYYNVVGSHVIEVVLEPKLVNLIKTTATFSGHNIATQKLHELSNTKGQVTLKVQHNELLAQALRDLI
jgi:hypothetical protein